jgi:hypothetical protein
LNSGSGGREVYLCYLAANRGDALKPSPAPEIGVTPTTPNMSREEPSEELSRLSRLANNLPNLPTLPAFLRSSETNNPKAETLQIASLPPEDDRSRFGINRFVSGVVNTKQRVTGRIRKAVGGNSLLFLLFSLTPNY